MEKNNQPEAIAYDFDKTLSVYEEGDIDKYGPEFVGPPIQRMIDEVRQAIADGHDVYIFTARVNPGDSYEQALNATKSYLVLADFCLKQFGTLLPITHEKSRSWKRIVDDRADQVIPNTGVRVTELMAAHGANR
jgi:hypothetical protein